MTLPNDSQQSYPRRAIWGWALYDWANSTFATTVMAGFFPVFFKEYWAVGHKAVDSTWLLLGVGGGNVRLLHTLPKPSDSGPSPAERAA